MKLLVAAIALSAAACSAQPTEQAPPVEPAAVEPAPTTSAGLALVVGKVLPGAIVTLEPTVAREFPIPAEPAVMDQSGMAFVPELLMVRVGQPVQFRSSEDVLHNVRVGEGMTNTAVFNVATPPFGVYTHVFDKPGYYNVSCDVHVDMHANIFVASTPYVIVADEGGTFTFHDVEPGRYTLKMLGGGKQLEQVIQVAGPRTEVSLEGL